MTEIAGYDLESQMPYYLTKEAKEGISKALKDFPNNINYYLSNTQADNQYLQGDGWSGLIVLDVNKKKKKEVKGIILSNSCDISSDNQRDLPPRIVFAPIVRLEDYERLLLSAQKNEPKVREKINAIKDQKVTSLFFLPKGGVLDSDHIALLDDLHSIKANSFYEKREKVKQFALSQVGFYLFVMKLSIHFCRLHENVDRDNLP